LKETLSIIEQAGVPHNGIGVRPYNPASANRPLAAQLSADDGDRRALRTLAGRPRARLRPKALRKSQYYNFGCATQRNLASMVSEPADLVQPRAETPAYTAKRTFGTDKWRKGDSPATTYPDATKGAISDLGK